jgi:hypothetical protein
VDGQSTGTGATQPRIHHQCSIRTTYYRVLINAPNNGCDQAVSANAVATIIADLVVTTQPNDVNEMYRWNNTITVSISGGSGTISYQWQASTDGINGWANATGTGANTAIYTPSKCISRNDILQSIGERCQQWM